MQPQEMPNSNLAQQAAQLAIQPGMLVEARDGLLGRVEQVIAQPRTGQPEYVVVGVGRDSRKLTFPVNMFQASAQPDRLQLPFTRQEAVTQGNSTGTNAFDALRYNDSQELRIPLVEEQLRVEKRPVELGRLHIEKTVEEVPENLTVPITRDDVEVQRVPVNQIISSPAQPHQDGDWYVVPVMKEMLVVEKRLMLVEEIRIRRSQVTEQQQITDTVRRERVNINDSSGLARLINSDPNQATSNQ